MHTKESLKADLEKMGIVKKDIVIVHSSIKSIGEVEGGVITVLDALIEYLSDGMLLIPSHTWMEITPRQNIFDVRKIGTCLGTLPLLAVRDPRGERSLHPTHSMVAFGRPSAIYTANELKCTTPTPPSGCWGRLADVNAKIMLIGVGQNKNTFLHAVDEFNNTPHRLSAEPMETIVRDKRGNETVVMMHTHRSGYGVDISENFTNFEEPFAKTGALTYEKFGDAEVQLCSARRCADVMLEILKNSAAAGVDPCQMPMNIPPVWYEKSLKSANA